MRRVILLLTLLVAALSGPAAAQAGRSLTLERFHSDIRVLESGEIDVIETLRFRFDGSWNGVFRDISLRHVTADGDRERLRVDVRSVADEAGNPLEYESSREDGSTRRLQIWVPGAENATRTVVIRYTVENALRFFDADSAEVASDADSAAVAFDELYWQVTGTEWEPTIQRASAQIVLPDGVEPLQVAAYTGYPDSGLQDATVDIAGNTVTIEADRALAPGEGLTVGVGWAAGVVHRPTGSERVAGAALRNWPILFPFVAFLLVFRRWKSKGRDPKPQSVAVQYEPPEGMTPAELGTLVDHSAQMHDLTATLVDLAVRGYLTIEERSESHLFGLVSDTEYVFHLRKPRSQWELAPHEKAFLNALFKSSSTGDFADYGGEGTTSAEVIASFARMMGEPSPMDASGAPGAVARDPGGFGRALETVKLSDLRNSFYKDLSDIRDAIYQELVRRGYYRIRPDHVKVRWIVGAVFTVGAGIAGAAFVDGSGFAGLNPYAVLVAAGATALILFGFGMVMPARTVRGARAREQALGFKEFLDRVETDRYKHMITSPEMFERYLPHAMAFGVEERWARAFEEMYTQPPEWYHGSSPGSFRASAFTSNLSRMSQEAGTTMASSPSSSGSGGGGSVGGGSGGGGGGGF